MANLREQFVPQILTLGAWPEPETAVQTGRELENDYGDAIELLWPVAYLPKEMGMFEEVETLPGETSYYTKIYAYFYPSDRWINLYGVNPRADGTYPTAHISFDELALLIDEADNSVREANEPHKMRIYRTPESFSTSKSETSRRFLSVLQMVQEQER